MYNSTGIKTIQALDNCHGIHDDSYGKTLLKLEESKIYGGYISEILYRSGAFRSRGSRMSVCANSVVFGRTPGKEGARLVYARFCRDRLCPGCQWRRALKTARQMDEIMAFCSEQDSLRYVFVTLTIPNVQTEDLADGISLINSAYRRMMRRKRFRFVRGEYRGIEITRNHDYDSANFGTWHPHLHAVWAVRPSYFTSRDYVSEKLLRNSWLDVLKAEGSSIPDDLERSGKTIQLRIENVRAMSDGSYAKAAAELCKYPMKGSDMCTGDQELDEETIYALAAFAKGRRFISLSGCLKDAHKALHLEDIDDPETLTEDENDVMYFGLRWKPFSSGIWAYQPDAKALCEYVRAKRIKGRTPYVRDILAEKEGTESYEQARTRLAEYDSNTNVLMEEYRRKI